MLNIDDQSNTVVEIKNELTLSDLENIAKLCMTKCKEDVRSGGSYNYVNNFFTELSKHLDDATLEKLCGEYDIIISCNTSNEKTFSEGQNYKSFTSDDIAKSLGIYRTSMVKYFDKVCKQLSEYNIKHNNPNPHHMCDVIANIRLKRWLMSDIEKYNTYDYQLIQKEFFINDAGLKGKDFSLQDLMTFLEKNKITITFEDLKEIFIANEMNLPGANYDIEHGVGDCDLLHTQKSKAENILNQIKKKDKVAHKMIFEKYQELSQKDLNDPKNRMNIFDIAKTLCIYSAQDTETLKVHYDDLADYSSL